MASTFQLSVVAPDRSVVETETASSVVAPGVLGYFGVLGNHVPMVAALRAGVVEYIDGIDRHYIAIGGGFCEISNGKVTILADSADKADEIVVAQEEQKLELAMRTMRGEDTSMTQDEARAALDQAMAKIKAAKRN